MSSSETKIIFISYGTISAVEGYNQEKPHSGQQKEDQDHYQYYFQHPHLNWQHYSPFPGHFKWHKLNQQEQLKQRHSQHIKRSTTKSSITTNSTKSSNITSRSITIITGSSSNTGLTSRFK